ncbi:glycosyltransferase [Peredibacter starrii]|uniref:Glycosyltransferase n=1 Tax=Peredibacter starrii TaxID=28202 RepID=A0AAX4HQT2_9BACT|nr:glycosyltransferase [Peredibacter starrii]WPU65695.1 glycosyltransferase [Peredibacter starrii]
MMNTASETSDLLVFSHLRWDFLFQRPQHLLSRQAKNRRVFYFEEPVFGMTEIPRLHLRETAENVLVVIPYLPTSIDPTKMVAALTDLVDELIYEEELIDYTLWYYSPKALTFSRHLEPKSVIFDYLDHLSYQKEQGLAEEQELLEKADIVFSAGQSIYEAKKHIHHNIHYMPSGLDYAHFSQGRTKLVEPDDQINIPHPRIGFYGVIDHRFNFDLVMQMADLKPEFQFVLAGPVVNLDTRTLPRRPNVHYLGKKDYYALPLYLAGWDATMMPYLQNETTRFVSPMKTLEYLAAGKSVVSTSVPDVVSPFGKKQLVRIADKAETFLEEIEMAMQEKNNPEWLDRIDHFLKDQSWDSLHEKMAQLELDFVKDRKFREERPRIIHPLNISTSRVV